MILTASDFPHLCVTNECIDTIRYFPCVPEVSQRIYSSGFLFSDFLQFISLQVTFRHHGNFCKDFLDLKDATP